MLHQSKKLPAGSTILALATLILSGCASTRTSMPELPKASHPAKEDQKTLVGQMQTDLGFLVARERERWEKIARPRSTPRVPRVQRDVLGLLIMPVLGVKPFELSNSFGAPRDNGKRIHRGIDIFARRGTPIVAVADGYLSFVGIQPKGGRCLWLSTEDGYGFYYAHLDQWAEGITQGLEVTRGSILGYVGNTGNALTTPPHLHFVIVDSNDEALNPYELLRKMRTPRPSSSGLSAGGGGR